MAERKETYIGNSKLKGSPEKPLKVILGEQVVKTRNIADKAVTKGKLGDESVEWKNISEDVQNIIASMEKGGVALSGKFGDSELIGINQKKLTEVIGPEGVITQKVATLEEVVGEGGSIDERIATAKSELIDGASEEGDTFKKIEDRLSDVEESVGEGGSVDERIAAGVSIERNRAQAEEELLREAYESLSQSQPIPKTAEEWEAMTSWEEGVIYRVAGTTSYTDYMYNGTTTIPMATYDNAIDDEPTAGSNNLVKSGGVARQISQLGQEVNDVSDILNGGEEEIKTPQTPLSTSGHINCSAAEIGQAFNRTTVASSEGAACWRIPVSIGEKYEIRAKGTSNSYALYVLTGNNDIVLAKEGAGDSKTNGIVLTITENGYLYVNDEEYSITTGNVYKFTTQHNDGLIEDVDDINTFLGDPIEGETLATLLNAKVDKVTGKSLIDANVAESINFIQESKWIDVKTDSENKILEGTKTDGTKVIESPLELQGVRQETIDNSEFIQTITDSEGKVIEAIKKNGKKVFYGGVEGVDSIQSVNIPLLDANFTSPIPCVITGTKGSETAKYDFETSLGKDSFNIRTKFRVTDNLLNSETTAQVLKLGNVVINATPTPLSQFSTSEIYNEQPVTMLWPDFNGGVKYGVSTQYKLGQYAFYIKYIGSEDSASVENNGTKLTIKSGSTTTEFPFSTYSTVSSLYNALKALTDIEVDFKEVEGRTTNELAIFPECQLKLTCYTRTGGSEQGEIDEYVDTPPFFIPYAVDDSWHQVEIVKIGIYIYCACDGATQIIPYDNSIDYSTLTLGDGNKMLFKDLNINLKSADDAEFYANGSRIVSSVNPAIIIFEGHGMYDGIIDSEAPDQLATSIDRLYYVFEKMQSMGYIPVSINDIAEYYAGNKDLPKRCYSIVFDDFRWENCLNAKYRKVFKELCVYPALAIITDRDTAITHNGTSITKKEAAEICLRNDFELLSHTRNHWKLDSVRLSTLISECMQDIYSADDYLVDGMILVYPGGRKTKYSISTLKWLGYSLGIGIAKADSNYASNQKDTNKYELIRVEIGVRTTLDIILNKLI